MFCMNRFLTRLFVPLAFICICGCSSNQENDIAQGYLATQIFDDGSKQFVYTFDFPESTGQRGKGNGRPGNVAGHVQGSSNRGLSGGVSAGTGSRSKGGGGGSGRGQQGKAAWLNDALEAELKKSGYCREGYIELDRMMQPSQTFIKGECVEAASANDREEFPNQIE